MSTVPELPYATLVQRNAGYVSPTVQQRLGDLRVLIAGCGMGSALAEALVRLGVRHLRLVDGDVVDGHNLNRQVFTAADIGRPKVEALRDRLIAINPDAEVDPRNAMLGPANVTGLLHGCDLILDTIDFLSLSGVIALHDTARALGLPVLSSLNIGFGGGVLYLPADGVCNSRQLFGLPDSGSVDGYSYTACYGALVSRIGSHIDPQVAQVFASSLSTMADGRPCPAPQVVAGSFSMAALTATVVVRLLSGEPVPASPRLILLSLGDIIVGRSIDLG